jgi:ATP-binding cassette subfamily C (CFTR/MRP) protein 1
MNLRNQSLPLVLAKYVKMSVSKCGVSVYAFLACHLSGSAVPESEQISTSSQIDSSRDQTENDSSDESKKPVLGMGGQGKAITALITEEDRAHGVVPLSVYSYYLTSVGSWVLPTLAFFISFFAQLCDTGANFWLAGWTSNYFVKSLSWYMSIYGAINAMQCLFNGSGSATVTYMGTKAATAIHQAAFQSLLRAPMQFFDATPVGRIVNRFSGDTSAVDNDISRNFNFSMLMVFIIILSLITVAIAFPFILVPLVPLMYAYFRIQSYYRLSSVELKRLRAASQSPILGKFNELLLGLATVRAFQEQLRFGKIYAARLNEFIRVNYVQLVASNWLSLRLESMGAVITGFSAGIAVYAANSVSPGLVGLALAYALGVAGFLNFMIHTMVDLENQMASVQRIQFFISGLPQEAPRRIADTRPAADWPTAGAIELRNVDMRYRADMPLVLSNVSLSIRGGEKVGVVGRTGAGKSSLLNVLFRLTEPGNGIIIIDDVDISKLGLADLRERLAIIPQDPVLYTGTIRSNLDPFGLFSGNDDALWTAVERAALRPALIAINGLDSPVTENGDNFSVGQRAQVCLARALLRKSKILVLDEATASIDPETDAVIQQSLRRDFAASTIITIAHRLSTIMDYDRVLVLDAGRVREFDAPANLLRDAASLFYAMARCPP